MSGVSCHHFLILHGMVSSYYLYCVDLGNLTSCIYKLSMVSKRMLSNMSNVVET